MFQSPNPIQKLFLVSLLACLRAAPALASPPIFEIEIRQHLFYPSRLEIPANTKIKLFIYNRDHTSEEFESYPLNREKIIRGGRKAVLFIGPLKPGDYPFFGEFNIKTAQGVIVVKDPDARSGTVPDEGVKR